MVEERNGIEPLRATFGSLAWEWSRSMKRIFPPDAGWLRSTKSIEQSHPTSTASLPMDGDWLIRQRRMRRSHRHESRSGWRSSVWRRQAELEARMALGVGSCSGGGRVWRRNRAPTVAELGAVGGACGTSACELSARAERARRRRPSSARGWGDAEPAELGGGRAWGETGTLGDGGGS